MTALEVCCGRGSRRGGGGESGGGGIRTRTDLLSVPVDVWYNGIMNTFTDRLVKGRSWSWVNILEVCRALRVRLAPLFEVINEDLYRPFFIGYYLPLYKKQTDYLLEVNQHTATRITKLNGSLKRETGPWGLSRRRGLQGDALAIRFEEGTKEYAHLNGKQMERRVAPPALSGALLVCPYFPQVELEFVAYSKAKKEVQLAVHGGLRFRVVSDREYFLDEVYRVKEELEGLEMCSPGYDPVLQDTPPPSPLPGEAFSYLFSPRGPSPAPLRSPLLFSHRNTEEEWVRYDIDQYGSHHSTQRPENNRWIEQGTTPFKQRTQIKNKRYI